MFSQTLYSFDHVVKLRKSVAIVLGVNQFYGHVAKHPKRDDEDGVIGSINKSPQR